jgi:hypothetical protein
MANLDLHRVVDLLPDRAAESFSERLKQHPEVATISRDRCGLYADAQRSATPRDWVGHSWSHAYDRVRSSGAFRGWDSRLCSRSNALTRP